MIPGLLHGALLGAPPAGGVVASPAYQSRLAFATGSSSSSATAGFDVNPDGSWSSDGTGYIDKSGSWYLPITEAIGAGYEVRITPTNTSGVAGVVANAAAGWVALNVSRRLQVTVQRFTAGTTVAGYSVLVEIRATGGAVVSSGTFPLTATAEVAASGGGGGGCPGMDMWLGAGLTARDVRIGRVIDGVEEGSPESKVRLEVMACLPSLQPCYRIVTSNGAACVLSDSTPFTLRGGGTCYAPEMLGHEVLRDDEAGGLVWDTVIECYPVGEQEVVRLNVGGQSLMAGENPLMRIVSHNTEKF